MSERENVDPDPNPDGDGGLGEAIAAVLKTKFVVDQLQARLVTAQGVFGAAVQALANNTNQDAGPQLLAAVFDALGAMDTIALALELAQGVLQFQMDQVDRQYGPQPWNSLLSPGGS